MSRRMETVNYENLTDEELMTCYQANETLAFNELFKRWKDRVWAYVSKRIFRASDREDVVQKVFMKLHNCKESYRDKFLFSQWIFTISKSVIIDHLRSNKNASIPNGQEFLVEKVSAMSEPDPEIVLDYSALTEDQKKVLDLRYMQELSFDEISKIINKSEVSIRKILSRSIEKLRRSKVLGGV